MQLTLLPLQTNFGNLDVSTSSWQGTARSPVVTPNVRLSYNVFTEANRGQLLQMNNRNSSRVDQVTSIVAECTKVMKGIPA
jgi:hypothetical protein